MKYIDVLVPNLPESVSNAQVICWHKKVGDNIKRGEILAEIETDKVILEVPSPIEGTLSAIKLNVGSSVVSTQVLATIDQKSLKNKSSESFLVKNKNENSIYLEPSPSIRKLMKANKVDISTFNKKYGKEQKITRENIIDLIEEKKLREEIQEEVRLEPELKKIDNERNHRTIERIKMTSLRKKISERLLFSQKSTVTSTTFNEVNMEHVLHLKEKYSNCFLKKYKVKLGLMSFFVKAVVESLKLFPDINASIDENDIVYYKYCDISIAVSTERGLMVPVLRNAENMDMYEIERKIKDFVVRGNTGKLSISDLTGGNITISNGGVFGSLMSTPIINPPQTAILGIHTIKKRVMVVEEKIVILPMMYIALSYDHRLIDGKMSIQFLLRVKEILEDFSRILLKI